LASLAAQGDLMRRVLRTLTRELTLPLVLLAAWWLISAQDSSLYVPSLEKIVDTMGGSSFLSGIGSALLASGKNFVAGIAIATLLGLSLGIVLGSVPLLRTAMFPLLEFWRAAPAVAILPLAIVFFGIGNEMKIVVIAFAAIWPILLNTVDAVRGIEPVIRDTARSYGLRRRDWIALVLLPAITPQFIAGFRTSLSIGITVIVISELVGSTNGLGFFILSAQRTFSFPQMWGGTIVLGLVGYLVNLSFRGIERSLLRRHGPAALGEQ
jgi:ABC-type nitrate/sulfonate/bicarbonate transport system permease component